MLAPDRVSVTFPAAVAGLEKLFDQVAIVSASSPRKEMAVLGPFFVAEYKPGAFVYFAEIRITGSATYRSCSAVPGIR